MSALAFAPGNLIRARGREWVVQPDSSEALLRLRPLGGGDEDIVTLIPALEETMPESATFPWPNPERLGNHEAAVLLRDALRLKMRSGAGPFRSFGNIAVEPRAYQLVPLLMALRLTTIRLLIADDVGIGKTIEAGLIARELMDRGEVQRLAVLCPPHLVEQWQGELWHRFNLQAVALTSASAGRLERNLPHGVSLFDFHPIVVVSLDYIKSERNRDHFLSIAPECIIVDEAHTCTASGAGKQLRFELLQRLVEDAERHLIMLTATPHSGDENAFYNLLSLLDKRFVNLQGITSASDPLRQELARHFVQRRRKDIDEWQENRAFPKRMISELTYELTGEWGQFFDDVQTYCRDMAETAEREEGSGARLMWYATLALLRCVSSSPAAAVKSLSTRMEGALDTDTCLTDERLYDGQADDLDSNDMEPPSQLQEVSQLQSLIARAEQLSGTKGDPKLKALVQHLKPLLAEGFKPVIFCRYVATAHYVAEHLKLAFKDILIDTVTGEYTPEEREQRVNDMQASEQRLLVATDCLSEGVNLQHLFDAVVHYDLAWNPTRHEQREGRVDRFGQTAEQVRCTMLYGHNNPVDGFILNVILRKGEAIEKELGVLVPMPEDETRINQALVKAALMKRRDMGAQAGFDFGEAESILAPVNAQWQDAMEKAKANRTVFAQRRIKPEEVLPEWEKQQQALGSTRETQAFLRSAVARLNAPLSEMRQQDWARLDISHLPEALKVRLADEGIEGVQILDMNQLHRSYPLVTLVADHLLEEALDSDRPIAARAAVTVTDAVEQVVTVFVLRLRHQLSYVRRHQTYQLMAEETLTLAMIGKTQPQWVMGSEADHFLTCKATGNLPVQLMQVEINQAIQSLTQHQSRLETLAQERAQTLLADHQRVREAAKDVGQYKVSPCLPVDVMGIFVLLPDAL